MATTSHIQTQSISERARIIDTINAPIGFFVLALLIVEAFLATILVGADLNAPDKMTGLWLGVAMFVLVVVIVSLLVSFRSKAFVFDRQAHLDSQKLEYEKQRRASGGAGLSEFTDQFIATLRRELVSEQVTKKVSQASDADLKMVLQEQADRISADIKQSSFISIDLTPFDSNLGVHTYPLLAIKDMNALTDEVYFMLEGRVRAYSYGTDWVLREKATGRVLRNLRMLTGAPVGQPVTDIRTLEEMGIKAGMELETIIPADGTKNVIQNYLQRF